MDKCVILAPYCHSREGGNPVFALCGPDLDPDFHLLAVGQGVLTYLTELPLYALVVSTTSANLHCYGHGTGAGPPLNMNSTM